MASQISTSSSTPAKGSREQDLLQMLKVLMDEAYQAPTEARRAEIAEKVRNLRLLIQVKQARVLK